MILTIDAGNTRTKWGVFDAKHTLIFEGVLMNDAYPTAPPDAWATCYGAIISCVAGNTIAEKLKRFTDMLGLTARFVQSTTHACGIENGYDNPSQLGTDRWAAIIAAWQQLKSSCVVVNAGTAVTIDALVLKPSSVGASKQGVFMGGLILPGLQLMQNSLLDHTAQIQLAAQHHNITLESLPTNTASAVYSGAVTAIFGAITTMLIQLQESRKEPIFCILSGGDAAIFAAALNACPAIKLSAPALVDAHLVLKGLLCLHSEPSTITR